MITPLSLTDAQLQALAWRIGDLLTAENIMHTGLEVTHVQDEGDCMKALYVYEGRDRKERGGTIYFVAHFTDRGCEDFLEIQFT